MTNCISGETRQVALGIQHICKSFGGIKANNDICLDAFKGEILSLLGENGSGKTTLMNICMGIYHQEHGEIYVNGEKAYIVDPHSAAAYGIGMVHQHFKLVDVFTATENIMLGLKDKYDKKAARERIVKICRQYGFLLDPDKKISDMTVSEKQTVEIVKVLFRNADILILDEPTAVLTPREIEKFFSVLREMKADGKSIIIITHKLDEVLAISDRVAVMRKGELVAITNTNETDKKRLTEFMVGAKVTLNIRREAMENVRTRLVLENIGYTDRNGVRLLDGISLTANSGEILGIAGISGCGQRELLEVIAGLHPITDGKIEYINEDKSGKSKRVSIKGKTPLQIRRLGIRLSFVPEDRLGMGLVGNMNITDNMMLRSYSLGRSAFVDRKPSKKLAEKIVKNLKVATPSISVPVRRLSGGNVQKVLVGREIAASPTVLMAAYPVRGLDITSSYLIYDLLNEEKESGVAVIFVGEDIDVMLSLCDRIIVMSSGRITGVLDGRTATKEEIGLLMTKGKDE